MDSGAAPGRPLGRVVRRGRVSWFTHPPGGAARVGVESRAFSALPVRLPEGDPAPREAAPGELLAVAHAMFLAWALSEVLADAGSPAAELVVEADCTFAGPVADRELAAVDLRVYGRGPGLNGEGFREAANAARLRYARASGLRGDIAGTMKAVLEWAGGLDGGADATP
jgi:osmotically inducible protein OsmC